MCSGEKERYTLNKDIFGISLYHSKILIERLIFYFQKITYKTENNKIGLSHDSPTNGIKGNMNTAYTRKYYNIILVMSFTLLSESSVCLQIMLVTMTFPKMERKLYLPLPIILVKKFNMSRLPSL
nr:MAG TPA: hypothetical protein [Caudoviricetes sp.]